MWSPVEPEAGTVVGGVVPAQGRVVRGRLATERLGEPGHHTGGGECGVGVGGLVVLLWWW